MEAKKSKVTRADLNAFFTNCLRLSTNFRPANTAPVKSPAPFPQTHGYAIPKRFGTSLKSPDRLGCTSLPIPDAKSRTVTKTMSPEMNTLVKPLSNKRNSYVCLTTLKEPPLTHKNHRRSVQYIAELPGHRRSLSREGGSSGTIGHHQQTPTNMLSLALLARKRAAESSQKRTPENLASKIQTKREFRTNFRDFFDQPPNHKLRVNFDSFVQKKTAFLNPKPPKQTDEKTQKLQEKMTKISQVLGRIADPKPAKSDAATAKKYKKYHEVNFVNSNVGDLLRDIAKANILERKPRTALAGVTTADSQWALTFKKAVIGESLRMMQEQIYFEEFLQVLAEKGVDVESMFSYCNQRLKIRRKPADAQAPDPTTISLSEVSVIDAAALQPAKCRGKHSVGKLDFAKVRKYSSSASEAED